MDTSDSFAGTAPATGALDGTSALSGEALDLAVATAAGLYISDDGFAHLRGLGSNLALPLRDWSPSENWEHGGPIIEREKIEIGFMGDGHGWQAAVNPLASADYTLKWVDGPTPLIAAMRAFVAAEQSAHNGGAE
jgi:hypothetical protein